MKFRLDADWKKAFSDIMYAVILILSALLIVFISIDTFKHIPFLENHTYMTFQFWVCVVFMLDFFIGLFLADNRLRYTRRRFLFLLLSIPYLNIVNYFGLQLTSDELYWVRFIPLGSRRACHVDRGRIPVDQPGIKPFRQLHHNTRSRHILRQPHILCPRARRQHPRARLLGGSVVGCMDATTTWPHPAGHCHRQDHGCVLSCMG